MNGPAIIWALIFAVGLGVTMWALADNATDRRILRQNPGRGDHNDRAQLLMRQRRLLVAFVGIAVNLAVGVGSIFSLPIPQILVVGGLFLGGLGYVGFVFLEVFDRQTMRSLR